MAILKLLDNNKVDLYDLFAFYDAVCESDPVSHGLRHDDRKNTVFRTVMLQGGGELPLERSVFSSVILLPHNTTSEQFAAIGSALKKAGRAVSLQVDIDSNGRETLIYVGSNPDALEQSTLDDMFVGMRIAFAYGDEARAMAFLRRPDVFKLIHGKVLATLAHDQQW